MRPASPARAGRRRRSPRTGRAAAACSARDASAAATSRRPQPASSSRPTAQCRQPRRRVEVDRASAAGSRSPARGAGSAAIRGARPRRRSPAASRTTCPAPRGTRPARSSSSPAPSTRESGRSAAAGRSRGSRRRAPRCRCRSCRGSRTSARAPVSRDRAHAEHVRERGRVVRVVPRAEGRLVGVADRRDHDRRPSRPRTRSRPTRAARSCRDSGRAGRGLAPRLMLITRAPLSTAQRIAFASASTGIVRELVTTFATSSSADGARPAMPIPLSTPRGDDARDERAVPERVPGRAADEALRVQDAPRELGMVRVDPGVDHGDRHAGRARAASATARRSGSAQVPLPRHQRVGGRERESPRDERLDVADAGDPATRGGAREVDDERRNRRAATPGGRRCGARSPPRRLAASAPRSSPTAKRAASAAPGRASQTRAATASDERRRPLIP